MPDPITLPPALNAFAAHRSIRCFLPQPLAPGHLDLIVEAGRRAPTDAQGHMYSLIRITDKTLRDHIASLCNDQQHIRDAAEFFVVCLDVYRLQLLVELRGGEWGLQERIALIYGATDATMAAQNMTVAAAILGYGTGYIGGVQNNTDRIAKDLRLPHGVLPLYGLCIGVPDPAELPAPRPRIPRDLCFFDNRYPETFGDTALESAYTAMSTRRDWYAAVEAYFAAGGTMQKRESVMARAWRQQKLDPKAPEAR